MDTNSNILDKRRKKITKSILIVVIWFNSYFIFSNLLLFFIQFTSMQIFDHHFILNLQFSTLFSFEFSNKNIKIMIVGKNCVIFLS